MFSIHNFKPAEKFLIFFTLSSSVFALGAFTFNAAINPYPYGPTQLGIESVKTPVMPPDRFLGCDPQPPCAKGIVQADGSKIYCLPGNKNWCPNPSIYPPKPKITNRQCKPYPKGCIFWQNGKPSLKCRFIRAENWCPPTCRPRPACLDQKPVTCKIMETPDMCPPRNPKLTVYPTKYPASCYYNGNYYQEGQNFKATDGCNICGCLKGKVACTLRECGVKINPTYQVPPPRGNTDPYYPTQ